MGKKHKNKDREEKEPEETIPNEEIVAMQGEDGNSPKRKKKKKHKDREEKNIEELVPPASPTVGSQNSATGSTATVAHDEIFKTKEDIDVLVAYMKGVAQQKTHSVTYRVLDFQAITINGVTGAALKSAFMKCRSAVFRHLPLHLEANIFEEEAKNFFKTRSKNKIFELPDKPKRPESAYFLFCKEQRKKVLPEGMSGPERMSYIAKLWRNLNDDERERLNAKYKKRKDKYEEEMKIFLAKHPELAKQESPTKKPQKKKKKPRKQPQSFLDLFSEDFNKKRIGGPKLTESQMLQEFKKLSESEKKHWYDLSIQLMDDSLKNRVTTNHMDGDVQEVGPKVKNSKQIPQESVDGSTVLKNTKSM